MDFAFRGTPEDARISDFAQLLAAQHVARGHDRTDAQPGTKLVFSHVDRSSPRPFRRRAQATYIVALLRLPEEPEDFLKAAYPHLVRNLANLLLTVVGRAEETRTYFLTLERGYYPIVAPFGTQEHAAEVADRLTPLATSQLIIDNLFDPDLEQPLWSGDAATRQLRRAGQTLDNWNLLPAPFPIQEMLPPDDFRHLQHLYPDRQALLRQPEPAPRRAPLLDVRQRREQGAARGSGTRCAARQGLRRAPRGDAAFGAARDPAAAGLGGRDRAPFDFLPFVNEGDSQGRPRGFLLHRSAPAPLRAGLTAPPHRQPPQALRPGYSARR